METRYALLGIRIIGGKLGFVATVKGKLIKPLIGNALRTQIIDKWNWIACRVIGHSHILADIPEERRPDGTYHCVDCCKPIRYEGGEPA